MTHQSQPPPDTLNEVGVLRRREIEARILGPVIEALGKEFDRARVIEIVRDTITDLARAQGAQLAQAKGDSSLGGFASATDGWRAGGALELEVLEQTDQSYSFDVTRCKYAEMYAALGMAELGAVFSCNRDYSLVEGYNPDIALTREQTIMQGAPRCAFRYRMRKDKT